jgi:hypothetical protein
MERDAPSDEISSEKGMLRTGIEREYDRIAEIDHPTSARCLGSSGEQFPGFTREWILKDAETRAIWWVGRFIDTLPR